MVDKPDAPQALDFVSLFFPKPDYDYFACRDVDALTTGASEFSLPRAWWCAELSLLAYVPVQHVDRHLAKLNLRPPIHFDVDGTQAFAVKQDDWAVVAFRGTELELADVVTDAQAWLASNANGEGAVHAGFQRALDRVWSDLCEALADGGGMPKRIWFTGHSLGGALAVLAADRLAPVASAYSYGCPRVGDRDFAQAYRARHYRIVNRSDMVPMVPPPGIYKHAGEFVYLDGNNELRTDTNSWERAKDRAFGHIEHVEKLVARWRHDRSIGVPSANLADHSPLTYSTRMWRALEQADWSPMSDLR